jgi:cytoskeletal protein RodZ
MEQSGTNRKREVIAALAVLIVIVVIVIAAAATNRKKTVVSSNTATVNKTTTSSTAEPSTASTSGASSSSTSPTSTSTYKDGTYTATGSYQSPGGEESITINVTLVSDKITATSAQSGAGDPESSEYQNDFISGYKSLVIGKDISSVQLSRVSGSSLTSQGFNDAINKIETAAKA